MRCVVTYQRGVFEDMVPLVKAEPQHVRHVFEQWYATHGDARLPLLLATLPQLTPIVILHAIAAGKKHIMDTLHLNVDDHDDLVAVAAASGHLDAIVQLHAVAYESGTSAALVVAAMHGHLNVVEYLAKHRRPHQKQATRAIDAAAGHGRLAVVQFLCVHLKSANATKSALRMAAATGHVRIVQWLHENGCQAWSADVLTLAAAGGHYNVLLYLQKVKPRLGAAKQAMDAAATNGHLKIVQFLHAQRPHEGCTDKAVHGALANGHKDVVEYLHKHRDHLIHTLCNSCGYYKPRNHTCKVPSCH
ncbi:hypothetical protein DYB32_009415 [Aphanomyces invadans]|nr:hypothetical protein DYB32_009415 [Aphanomyces invadans]